MPKTKTLDLQKSDQNNIYMYDRYKIIEERNEEGCIDYKIVSSDNPTHVEEVYNDKSEAEDALKFWNQ